MKVLVGCECSGVVRDAFLSRGHDAWSCDLLASKRPGPHIQDDLLRHLADGWDLMIVHPDCTYLCSSGLHWNVRPEGMAIDRAGKTRDALAFVRKLLAAPVDHIALENPTGAIGSQVRPADHYVHPYQFGHDASKRTGLWLKRLPRLRATRYVPPRLVMDRGKMRERWGNQTDGGQNKLGPSDDRWFLRAETYQGIADAMADQWPAWIEQQAYERDRINADLFGEGIEV